MLPYVEISKIGVIWKSGKLERKEGREGERSVQRDLFL